MKKTVLITSTCTYDTGKNSFNYRLDRSYGDAVAAGGGIPVIVSSEKIPSDYADMADGLLLTGGESVHPTYFGETFDHLANDKMDTILFLRYGCNIARDEMEMAVLREFARRGKPILGICRGMQMVNAATGVKNDLDFPRRHPVEHNLGVTHEVAAEPDSLVGRIFGERFITNSYHRDCAVSTGPDMRVTARSADGIIEAIEHVKQPIWGVQFHPERMRGDHPNPAFGQDATELFRYFVSRC